MSWNQFETAKSSIHQIKYVPIYVYVNGIERHEMN